MNVHSGVEQRRSASAGYTGDPADADSARFCRIMLAVHARQLSYFLAVVDHGGFGRAAAVLSIAQPTLSQSVKGLERELGAELFHRASPGDVLTAAGRALVGPARQLVRDVNAARASVG